MPELVVGPLLRHVDQDSATVWVETDGPCQVEVLGHRARTFHLAGHHYGLVAVDGLSQGSSYPYDVRLDGVRRWPEPGSAYPPSVIRTLGPVGLRTLTFGSCRVTAPPGPPSSLPRQAHPEARGVDALAALAEQLRSRSADERPDLLLLLGDQVYADEVPAGTRAFIRTRRAVDGPHGEEVADFEEYTHLYREAWTQPAVRWLLSTVPTAMVFDDHDVHDDWNTSAAWRQEIVAEPWWRERIIGAFSSYWLYQHLGNLSPQELATDPLFAAVQAADDAESLLRAFAERADGEPSSVRWSYRRDLGPVRLVVIDSRAGRLLDGVRREMLDDQEWDWLEDQICGDVDHLLVATSLPYLLPHAIHFTERWNEALAAGAWGRRAAALAERLRRRLDLEHWSAFGRSFDRLTGLLDDVRRGKRGAAPATILVLSGDIHCSYLAEVDRAGAAAALYQAVCSPIRNELPRSFARSLAHAWHGGLTAVMRGLARAARVQPTAIRWRLTHGPCFANGLMTFTHDGRRADLRLDLAVTATDGAPALRTQFTVGLSEHDD